MDNPQLPKEKPVNPLALQIPDILPVMPLNGFVFFPGMGFPLQVASDSSKQLVDDALLGDRMIVLIATQEGKTSTGDDASSEDLFRVGLVGYIHKLTKVEQGYYQVLVSGTKKIEVVEFIKNGLYLKARVKEIPMEEMVGKKIDALIFNIRNQFQKLVKLTPLAQEMAMTVNSLADPFHMAYMVISQLNLNVNEEQSLLEIRPLDDLLHQVARELNKRIETAEMSNQLQDTMKKDMDHRQREFFLRQQLKAIKKELGEGEDDKVEVNELRKRVDETGLSDEARKTVDKELGRLERIPPS